MITPADRATITPIRIATAAQCRLSAPSKWGTRALSTAQPSAKAEPTVPAAYTTDPVLDVTNAPRWARAY